MKSLPKESRSQEIGRLASRALGVKMPSSWVETAIDGDTDFGIDYTIQLKSDSDQVNYSFYLQLKGTTEPYYINGKSHVSYQFSVKSLNYYRQQEPLVMIAVVDLKGNEKSLHECPIYYMWLDDEWFITNEKKLSKNETISIAISTSNIITNDLNVYDFYSDRINKKFLLNELGRNIKSYTLNFSDAMSKINENISEKPVLIKVLENKTDTPWVENPTGTVSAKLKECSEYLDSNKIQLASECIHKIKTYITELSVNEKAELFFLEGRICDLRGEYNDANEKFKIAYEICEKERYLIGYTESCIRVNFLEENDNKYDSLAELIGKLTNSSFNSVFLKAKYLALTGETDKGLSLLAEMYPDNITGKLVLLTMSQDDVELDSLISDNIEFDFSTEREKYIFSSIAARRFFTKSVGELLDYNEVLPLEGRDGYNVEYMKLALKLSRKAWEGARNLGYPSDVIMLLDITPLVYGFFGVMDELYVYFDDLVKERVAHKEVIKVYSRLLFNDGKYPLCIELLSGIEDDIDVDDIGLLILSHYNSNNKSEALRLTEKYEGELKKKNGLKENAIFCLAMDIAFDSLNNELANRLKNYISEFPQGGEIFAVRNFVKNSNETPSKRNVYINELFEKYEEYNKSYFIAEQLLPHVYVVDELSANRYINLCERLLAIKELKSEEYLSLARAFFITQQWVLAEKISEKNINKTINKQHWIMIRSTALHYQGKIGEAFETVKSIITLRHMDREQLAFYVNLCLSLGLWNDAETILKELLLKSEKNSDKVSILEQLISVYSSSIKDDVKLNNSITRYGELVDEKNEREEGRYLACILTHSDYQIKDKEKIRNRFNAYFENFPDSPYLKKFNVNVTDGPEGLINSLNKIVGIQNEDIQRQEKNRIEIINGKLPVPFNMLERFLGNTRSVFESWDHSLNSKYNITEFNFRQSPQLDINFFQKTIECGGGIFIEETSLLILSEVGLLDKFLALINRFYLTKSCFDNISRYANQSLFLYDVYPRKIISVINKHIPKLNIIDIDKKNNISMFHELANKINNKSLLTITDDLNFIRLLLLANPDLVAGNSINVVCFLDGENTIDKEEKYQILTKICGLGVVTPNMHIGVLCDILCYFFEGSIEKAYFETPFKVIFDKLFTEKRDTKDAIELFFKMIINSSRRISLSSTVLLSLFRGVLLRHEFKNLDEFVAFWFVCSNINIEPKIEAITFPISSKNCELWSVLQSILIQIDNKYVNITCIIELIIKQISLLTDAQQHIAYRNIKTSFPDASEPYIIFNKMFQELIITQALWDR